MDVKERIQKYLDFKGIKTATLEREVGMSNGYWRKTKSISANIVSDILRAYSDLSERWVLFGEGTMCGCSADTDTDDSFYHPSQKRTTSEPEAKEEQRTSEDLLARENELLRQQVQFLKEQVEFYKNRK